MSKRVLSIALALSLSGLPACSAAKPTLYPNEQYNKVGKEQAERDIADCEARAEEYVKTGGQGGQKAADAARNVGVGAAVGAAGGAVGGAIGGNVGQGAAAGAAGGATAGLVGTLFGWMFEKNQPDPVYSAFVDRCLRDKGYDPIGWS